MILTGLIAQKRQSGPSTPALIGHTGVSDNGSGASVTTPGIDTSGASFLVAVVSTYGSSSTNGLHDNYGNTWVPLTRKTGIADPQILYVARPIVGPGHTFTAHDSSASGTGISVMAFSGVRAIAPFESGTDKQANSTPGSTVQPGSVSPADTGDLIVTGLGVYTNFGTIPTASIDSGFSIADTLARGSGSLPASCWSAFLGATSASPINPTWTSSLSKPNIGSVIGVFKHS